jgi:hypothetical protein
MLSNNERERLHELERQLIVDDPDFERSFHELGAASPEPPALRRLGYTAVIVVATFLALLMLVAGSPGGAFVFGLVAGSVWLAQYFHDAANRKPEDGRQS